MKIKADYANAPQWKETTIKSSLPKELKCLDEIAHNMWWAWNYEGRDLFKSLDADLYEKCNANPVLLLERLSYDRKEAIVKDKETMAKVKNVYKMFREYMDVKPNSKRPSVAYFCMEYGINQVVKIYSGGLGMLAGDYMKEASDSNVDMCGVGFLYRYGYFKQSLSMDGQQIANYDAQNFNSLPLERVLDENGKPTCEYVQADGTTVTGAYDCVPLLDQFIAEHPDASYHGAKGMIALTGYDGILGYRTDIAYKTHENLTADQQAWLDAHPDFDYDKECEEAKKVAEELEKIKLQFKVKQGENGKIFGGISSKEIAEKLEKQQKIKVDKKKIELRESIKTLGITKVSIKLYEGVIGTIKVEVLPE